jgi:hypothetical protein
MTHKTTVESAHEVLVPPGVDAAALEELIHWWLQKAGEDAVKTVPKAIEYGSADMIEMGRDLMDIAGRHVDDAEAAEIGTWFYVLGKVKRWQNAIKRGERVSDDTLLDIAVYAMMARRIRDVGGWPGVVL